MKKIFLILAVSFAALSLSAQSGNETILNVGDVVPEFSVTMVDGSTIKMSDLRGKYVLVNFWATWCPPCRAELARVQTELVDRFAGQDFVFLPISRGETLEKVMAFRGQTGYTFQMGIDPESLIFPIFAESGIPRNYLVGPDGVIVEFELGYTSEAFDHLVEKIDEYLRK